MKEKVCCIFGAGEYFGTEKAPDNAFIIAADAGIKTCEQQGLQPDVIIGDFDSLGHPLEGKNVITLPKIKDDTDTLAAVKYGLKKGFKTFILFGCTGGRLSHTVANIQTLTYIAKHDATGFLTDKEEIATASCKGFKFDNNFKGFISVFAAEGNVVITETGLKYSILHSEVTAAYPYGVSNEFTGNSACLTVHKGVALIIIEKNEGVFKL